MDPQVRQLIMDMTQVRRRLETLATWNVQGLIFEKNSKYGPFTLGGYPQEASASVVVSPWTTTRDDEGETLRVSVHPGTINSLVPTNIFDPIEITGIGVEYIVLTMTSTGDSPVSASLSKETTYPVPSATTPSNPPTAVTDVLAVLNDGVVYQVRDTNLVATSVEVLQETVANPVVGERQYIPWYRWEVT